MYFKEIRARHLYEIQGGIRWFLCTYRALIPWHDQFIYQPIRILASNVSIFRSLKFHNNFLTNKKNSNWYSALCFVHHLSTEALFEQVRFPSNQNFRWKFRKLSVSNSVERLFFFHLGEELRFQFQICNLIGRPKNLHDGAVMAQKRQQNWKWVFCANGMVNSLSVGWNGKRSTSEGHLFLPENFRWIRAFYLHFNRLNGKFSLMESAQKFRDTFGLEIRKPGGSKYDPEILTFYRSSILTGFSKCEEQSGFNCNRSIAGK